MKKDSTPGMGKGTDETKGLNEVKMMTEKLLEEIGKLPESEMKSTMMEQAHMILEACNKAAGGKPDYADEMMKAKGSEDFMGSLMGPSDESAT